VPARRYSQLMSDARKSPNDEGATPSGDDNPEPQNETAAEEPEDVTAADESEDAIEAGQPEDATAASKRKDAAAGGDNEKRFRGVGRGEDIGKLAQDLLEHPMVTGALSAVFETRERAARAQEVAMSALNLPSASDIERLTRRLRSVSQRLEGLEDGIDEVAGRLDRLGPRTELNARLDAIEAALGRIEASLGTKGSESD
jgi:hypothetical protein